VNSSKESPLRPGTIAQRLDELGITLPIVPPLGFEPTRVYLTIHAGLGFVSGVGPIGQTGVVGADLTVEQGYAAARTAALFCLSRLTEALGSLERISSWVKVLGFVRSAPGFGRQPEVVNGFSDLIVSVFGERGRSARSAIGTSELPLNMPVEIEAVIAIHS
jgi:enamine deaminase RidA (YjgF/YER057c/UK114 family)